jgi:hypothetical protein
MALYSAWDWDKNAWAVYSTPDTVSVGDDPVAPKPKPSSPIGLDPDTAVKELPRNAKFVGYQHLCHGEVRRMPGTPGMSGVDDSSSGRGWALPAALGFVSGWVISKLLGGRSEPR